MKMNRLVTMAHIVSYCFFLKDFHTFCFVIVSPTGRQTHSQKERQTEDWHAVHTYQHTYTSAHEISSDM